jgi:hypothetical protein
MDVAIGDIRAVEFTSSRQGDSPVLPDRLAQTPADQPIGTVTADGAYDTRACHTAVTGVAPQRSSRSARTAVAGQENGPAAKARNETLRATRHFGRVLWKRLTGHHARSRIEAQMLRPIALGDRIISRDPDCQTAEIHIRVALMNRFLASGQAEIMRVA